MSGTCLTAACVERSFITHRVATFPVYERVEYRCSESATFHLILRSEPDLHRKAGLIYWTSRAIRIRCTLFTPLPCIRVSLTMIVHVLFIVSSLWLLWKLYRYFKALFVSPLNSIPGPVSESFLTGEFCVCILQLTAVLMFSTGNLRQLYNINAWSFHTNIAEEFGQVVKIWGQFGVGNTSIRPIE